MKTIEDAIVLAAQAHKGQIDRTGKPYIFHPMRVALSMPTASEQMAAILHDIVEDTPVTLGDLEVAGYPVEVIEAVALLTHQEDAEYSEYIRRIRENPVARRVKVADLRDNLDGSRIASPTKKDRERTEKYRGAMKILGEDRG